MWGGRSEKKDGCSTFGLRELKTIFGCNLNPHSEPRPEFYSLLLDRFSAVHSSLPDLAWGSVTAKSLYNIFGSFEPVVLILESRGAPLIQVY